ncbi:MAG: magnesium/cobalt transporter CorA [Ignavibacteriaceae bacterium]|jgi:magnesium transporter|nr:magnesium/cobalt transporter CorA [Psychromonas sp.]MCW9096418.1 magnesium/cobalt transporter CorA [Ignavibacteriaceae bacterium]
MKNSNSTNDVMNRLIEVPKTIIEAPINLLKQLAPKRKKKTSSKIGLPPGSIVYLGEKKVDKVTIKLTEYDEKNAETYEIKSVEEIDPFTDTPQVTWVSVCGLHETEFLKQVGEKFKVHPLVLEDILNTETRPKIEITDDYLFIVMKLVLFNPEHKILETEQVSFILGRTFLFSFSEKSDEIFNPIKERIATQLGKIRKKGPDYLLYALMDIVVDNYFLALEKIEERIETLDDEVINNPERSQIESIYNLRNLLLMMRRSIWPYREIVNQLIKDDSDLLDDSIEPYLRDLYDHTIHITETIEQQREITNGLMEIYLSMMSNKMNEVMKVLTVIATIFIPLTFIVGIYGMNFKYMPELDVPWAYYAVWGVMFAVVVTMVIYFRRKNWF